MRTAATSIRTATSLGAALTALAGCTPPGPPERPATASPEPTAAVEPSSPTPAPSSLANGEYAALERAATALGTAWSRPEIRAHSACTPGEAGMRTIVIVRPGDDVLEPANAAARLLAAGFADARAEDDGDGEGDVIASDGECGELRYGDVDGRPGPAWSSACDSFG